MAKKNTRVVDDADDLGVTVDLSTKASRKFGGDDGDPTDLETGEELFADITPRLRDVQAADEPEDEDEDEDLNEPEDEPVPEEEEEELDAAAADAEDDLDEVDSDTEAARNRKKPGKWTRRLEREKRLREEAAEENRELRERLDKIEANSTLQANTDAFNKTKTDLETKLTKTRAELTQAVEDGDSEAQARLQDAIIDIKVDLKAETVKFETAKKQVAENTSGTGAQQAIARKANQWTRKHPKFDRDPVFATFVRAIDKQLAAEGHDARSDDYYKELDKRVKERFPEEYPRSAVDAKKRRHPSQMQSRESDRSTAPAAGKNGFRVRGNKITLTPQQVQTMRTFQLDPTNPSDVRAFYVNNK